MQRTFSLTMLVVVNICIIVSPDSRFSGEASLSTVFCNYSVNKINVSISKPFSHLYLIYEVNCHNRPMLFLNSIWIWMIRTAKVQVNTLWIGMSWFVSVFWCWNCSLDGTQRSLERWKSLHRCADPLLLQTRHHWSASSWWSSAGANNRTEDRPSMKYLIRYLTNFIISCRPHFVFLFFTHTDTFRNWWRLSNYNESLFVYLFIY